MELYWRGRNAESNIDILTELQLQAYISKEYAIITVRDSNDKLKDLQEEFEKPVCEDGFFWIAFSPQGIVTGLSYLIETEDGRQEQDRIIQKFKTAFYNDISELVKQGKHKRPEMVRLIWRVFNEQCPASVDEVRAFYKNYQYIDVVLRYTESMRQFKKDYLRLTMQYAMYLLIWEKSYGKDDILCAIPGKMSTKSEERCIAKKKGLEMLAISRETFRARRYEKAKKILSNYLNDAQCKKDVLQIQERVYNVLNWNCSQLARDEHRIFFYENWDAEKKEKLCLYEAYVYAKWIFYNGIKDKKKLNMDLLLGCVDISVDVSGCIMDKLIVAVEIVLMNLININDIKGNTYSGIYKYANRLQLKIFVILYVLLEHSSTEELNEDLKIETCDYELNVINNEIIERLNIKMELYCDELDCRLDDIYKYFGEHDDKDGYVILGTIFLCASYKYGENGNEDKIKERARKKTRNYWSSRKKHIDSKLASGDWKLDEDDVLDIIEILIYIHNQNSELIRQLEIELKKLF